MIATTSQERSVQRFERRRKRRIAMFVRMLTQWSVQEFNAWREQRPEVDIILEGADLSGLDLPGANLQEANLAFAKFRGTNLTGADFSRSSTWRTDFTGADTTGTNFEDAGDLF